MKSLIHRIKTFWNTPIKRKVLVLKVISLSIYRGYLVLIKSPNAFSEKIVIKNFSTIQLSQQQFEESRDIAFAVQTAAKYIPWPNACRHQSWQAIQLLKKQNIPFTYFVGVKKNNPVEGHSWVIVGDRFICGFCDLKEYHQITY
ncbi:transglutaminase superfamily protein [Algoriphagus boseongensis]|uniref:Transglutaminase superfamily protein n=1 Tax=Algoriphagus boseongensis TaxID=1442587 RepID=A0A4R6TD61_9BACT|nr:lasso peptide biosynthesis B2 protein [Algoriphagus boseongensis]TDQ19394.1 transglutaminase superfamily protein [Algoriphagus boseongensis]